MLKNGEHDVRKAVSVKVLLGGQDAMASVMCACGVCVCMCNCVYVHVR